jgi:hypothetical protein
MESLVSSFGLAIFSFSIVVETLSFHVIDEFLQCAVIVIETFPTVVKLDFPIGEHHIEETNLEGSVVGRDWLSTRAWEVNAEKVDEAEAFHGRVTIHGNGFVALCMKIFCKVQALTSKNMRRKDRRWLEKLWFVRSAFGMLARTESQEKQRSPTRVFRKSKYRSATLA